MKHVGTDDCFTRQSICFVICASLQLSTGGSISFHHADHAEPISITQICGLKLTRERSSW